MGAYDVPDTVDYIRFVTGQDKISLLAHSEGTASTFTALTFNVNGFQDKLHMFIALGPVVRLDDVRTDYLRQISENVYNI